MAEQGHHVMLEERRRLAIKGGVLHVHSFDGGQILLETSCGFMELIGEELHIEELNLEQGDLTVTGKFSGIKYSEGKGIKEKGKSFLGRILK